MPKVEKKDSERQWECSECTKTFSRKGDLTRHESLHQGIKPHVCDTCHKAFSQYSGLKTHMNVHTREKPYVCNFANSCDARFGDPSSCARHRKETHRRLAGFHCLYPRCNSRIKRRSAFCSHLKRHGIDPSTIDVDSLAPPLLPSVVPVPSRRANRSSIFARPADVVKTSPKPQERPTSRSTETDRDFYYSLRTGVTTHPSDAGLNRDPFGRFDTYHGPYPSTLPASSISTTFSQLTSSSRTLDFDGNVSPRWEGFSELYSMDSSPSRPSNINLRSSPPSTPSRNAFIPPSVEQSGSKEIHTVNITHGTLTFDHFSYPPANNSYHGPGTQKPYHDAAPNGKTPQLSYFTNPSSETAWNFP